MDREEVPDGITSFGTFYISFDDLFAHNKSGKQACKDLYGLKVDEK
jgi:hypothetical protein